MSQPEPTVQADPYTHLPQLRGCLTPAEQSALRLTPQTLAVWDAQACAGGLPPDWRWSEQQIEASRQAVLAPVLGPVLGGGPTPAPPPQDLWVFGYGSLMWDPAIHFSELRRAALPGHARRFSFQALMGRGTPERPALMLALEPADAAGTNDCHGLVFRIPAALAAEESALLWRREMIRGGYLPRLLPLRTPQGPVQALVFLANPGHESYIGALPLAQAAATIAVASGRLGRNRDYLSQLDAQLLRLGIADSYIHQLWAAVQALPSD